MSPLLLLAAMIQSPPQPVGASIDSMDVLLLAAENVLVGRVTKAGLDPDNRSEITVAVEETLKGRVKGEFETTLALSIKTCESWNERKTRVLIIAQPRGGRFRSTGFDLESKLPQPVPTADLKILREPADVLDFAKALLKKRGKQEAPKIEVMLIPEGTPNTEEWGFVIGMIWMHELIVPVDKAFEKRMRDMIAMPYKQGWNTDETPFLWMWQYRARATRSLRHFRSQDNISLLKKLLSDEQYVIQGQKRVYPVREAAREVLVGWDVMG